MPKSSPTQIAKPIKITSESELAWRYLGGWSTVFVVAMLLLMGLGVAGFEARQMQVNSRFVTNGVTVDGRIIDKQTASNVTDRRNQSTYWLAYTFTDAAGMVRTRRAGVPQPDYERWNVGDAAPVQYLSDDPVVSRLVGSRTPPWVAPVIGGGFALLFAGLAMWIWVRARSSARKRARTVFRGEPRPGQVVSIAAKTFGKATRHILQYRYLDLTGKEQSAEERLLPAGAPQLLQDGQALTVLIDPKNPKLIEADVFGVRGPPMGMPRG